MAPAQGPKLFIGSSSESLPVVQLLQEALKNHAVIRAWTDRSIFKPTDFYVESLLNIPRLYDFGLFLFEPDDVVESRGAVMAAPRDNVIFEFGLFMSHLGLKRAFALAPRSRVKILSDIAGLKPIEYDEPSDVAQLRAELAKAKKPAIRKALVQSIQSRLQDPLEPAIEDIRELLKQGVVEATGVFADAANVVQVAPVVVKLVRAALDIKGEAAVRHLALDMSEAWGILANEVLNGGSKLRNVSWRCLMIDPKATSILRVASPSVSAKVAGSRVTEMGKFVSDHGKELAARKVSFECKLYAEPPMMHGFHIEKTALLWSMCDIAKGKLEGAKTPYWRFEAADEMILSAHPARAFQNWFDYRWQTARPAW
jgi:Predicted nucleotide-binding protein containing TIR-like domain